VRSYVASLRSPPHRPGTGTRPDTSHLEPLITALPRRVDDASWQSAEAYIVGFDLLESGYAWEAHEVWEAAWRRTRPQSREYYLLRALIQIANASLKRHLGHDRAAARIWPLALDDLQLASGPDAVLGFAPERIADLVRGNANGTTTELPKRPNSRRLDAGFSKLHHNTY